MPPKPNIIYIVTDQQSAGAASAWGWPQIDTPNLDRLISGGVTCSSAYCTNPVCVPSRFSLLTGKMPSIGATRNNHPSIERQPAEITQTALGHAVRAAGYRTLYAGKEHLPAMSASDCGFEILTADERDACAETAAQFLAQQHEQPFCLFVSLINPHDICFVPHWLFAPSTMNKPKSRLAREVLDRLAAPWYSLSASDRLRFIEREAPTLPVNHPRTGAEPELLKALDRKHPFIETAHCHWGEYEWRLYRWIYDRLIEDVDRLLGVVLDAIDRHHPDALVIFTSDHGELNGAHRLTQKGVFYEEAIKIPLVARWTGVIPAGSHCERLISNGLDCFPTILTACGLPEDRYPEGLTGHNLLPSWHGDAPTSWRKHLTIELDGGECTHDGRHKCEHYFDGSVIVRDLELDPWELQRTANNEHSANY